MYSVLHTFFPHYKSKHFKLAHKTKPCLFSLRDLSTPDVNYCTYLFLKLETVFSCTCVWLLARDLFYPHSLALLHRALLKGLLLLLCSWFTVNLCLHVSSSASSKFKTFSNTLSRYLINMCSLSVL